MSGLLSMPSIDLSKHVLVFVNEQIVVDPLEVVQKQLG